MRKVQFEINGNKRTITAVERWTNKKLETVSFGVYAGDYNKTLDALKKKYN
jgi:hypothetical protein